MRYRTLGASGLKVSPICLGTMLFGSRTDEAEAGRIVGSARDAGINFIDTAVSYAGGRGETIVGGLLAADRDRWVIATKVGSRTGDGPNEDGTNRRQIQASIEHSLRRLRTDRVDLYYLHRDDETTPLHESLFTPVRRASGAGPARLRRDRRHDRQAWIASSVIRRAWIRTMTRVSRSCCSSG